MSISVKTAPTSYINDFPKVMKSPVNHALYLMIDRYCGTCIAIGVSSRKVGLYYNDITHVEDYNDPVIIQNNLNNSGE